MPETTFDSLACFERLVAAGVPETQARVQADALLDITDGRLVTREYLDMRLKELEYRIIVRLGALVFAASGIIIAAIGIMLKS